MGARRSGGGGAVPEPAGPRPGEVRPAWEGGTGHGRAMTIPRYGTPPAWTRRHRLRPGVYAVIALGGGVLLTVQADGDGAPELQLPGGGTDPGEQPLAAPRRLGAYRVFKRVPGDAWPRGGAGGGPTGPDGRAWAEKVCTVYAARAGRRLHPPTEPGHAAVVLGVEDARLALSDEGGRRLLDRALALGLL